MKIDLILIGNQGVPFSPPPSPIKILSGAGKTSPIKRYLYNDSEAKSFLFLFSQKIFNF